MPEMYFRVTWPDGTAQRCYSPSLVIEDFLKPGERYPVADFVRRSDEALTIASNRVREKYGFACTSAAAMRDEIWARAKACPEGEVTVVSFEHP
ncbi:MSMEG_0570 family nitrogen starvation response protein [Kineosporia mesophila]|uniref:MSMEG_0570 family nitrogen starvation response protein n=1 Tax=Kineosporia mesophila TaxID=566012 RepID=A0ABP7AES0_9ACTN|nr:MSMEG_0570 family nitrogen starvation response protein [Kineosporia mesophila]MCD5354355.1 MSMEG_0570 family nitrogen starvation response protein [Kineosporia mesophila]